MTLSEQADFKYQTKQNKTTKESKRTSENVSPWFSETHIWAHKLGHLIRSAVATIKPVQLKKYFEFKTNTVVDYSEMVAYIQTSKQTNKQAKERQTNQQWDQPNQVFY